MQTCVVKPNPVGGGATYTIYSESQSGYVFCAHSDQGSYAYNQARNGTGDIGVNAGPGNAMFIGQSSFPGDYHSGPSTSVSEGFFGFDTSSIVGTITSALIYVSQYTPQYSTYTPAIEARGHDWGGTLTSADFVPGADLAAKPLLASISRGDLIQDTPVPMVDSNLIANINRSGFTRMVLADVKTRNYGEPSEVYEQIYIHGIGSTALLRPKLVVVTA